MNNFGCKYVCHASALLLWASWEDPAVVGYTPCLHPKVALVSAVSLQLDCFFRQPHRKSLVGLGNWAGRTSGPVSKSLKERYIIVIAEVRSSGLEQCNRMQESLAFNFFDASDEA